MIAAFFHVFFNICLDQQNKIVGLNFFFFLSPNKPATTTTKNEGSNHFNWPDNVLYNASLDLCSKNYIFRPRRGSTFCVVLKSDLSAKHAARWLKMVTVQYLSAKHT
jgi:hypothetical protein